MNSEKKYLATRDHTFLTNLTEEVDEFQRSLQLLRGQENSSQGVKLLQETDELLKERLKLFQNELQTAKGKVRRLLRSMKTVVMS